MLKIKYMKIADLYIRVSTDEQADKGYSQRDQDERLRKYCELNSIKVRKVIFEDHSAKTFNRPKWAQYLAEIRKNRGRGADFVLFTKWDRFSRNAGDAYQMIAILMKLGIEPQAIEQPLNLEIPENKIMLAFYLAAPEVENDRRALNVKHGMRRASKEGRYMGPAPIGYDNKTREDGSKYISPNKKEAPFIQWIFKTIAEGVFAPDQIRKVANDKGFMISRMNFYREIRNPVYCGKIILKKYKDEEEQWVNGLHEALISEALFYKVQDIVNGRTKVMRVQAVKINEGLPLQGFLQCATCDRQLTASASKGKKGGYYYYYHAQSVYGCGCRYRADEVNKAVLKELAKYIPIPGMNELYKLVVLDIYKEYRGTAYDERKAIVEQIERLTTRLANARELLFDEKLDHSDFAIMKKDCEEKIKRLEASLIEVRVQKSNTMSIDNMLIKAIEALSNLKSLYENGDALTKREVLGSIFREKLRFDGNEYRTPRLNEAAQLIYQINKKLRGNKNGKERDNLRLSRPVLGAGIEPALALGRTGF
jgi:site-specific DNA recombinase